MKRWQQTTILIVALAILAGLIVRHWAQDANTKKMQAHLQQFNHDEATLRLLKEKDIAFDSHSFANSVYNIFQDYDKDVAIETLVRVLSEAP